MKMIDLIFAKKAGAEHSRKQIDFIINGVVSGDIPDYQISAWLMAVCWRGMSMQETADLTDAMARSGAILDLSSVGPLIGDKHSTGGVGDKTTLILVPLLAAAGIPMAKLSGRGLGHTGGTIDKLEAIPGFKTDLTTKQFVDQVKRIGMAIGGQTQDLAPADGKIYALRDVTATVDSIPLIAASVMSKKIAAGANLIILDVKSGSGAFMTDESEAIKLAQTMYEVGKRLGKPVSAVVTDMDQPLGNAVGNTLEVIESIETLKGKGPKDLTELCLVLGSLAMVKSGKAADDEIARKQLMALMENGTALNYFKRLIEAQGGDVRVIDNPELMPRATETFDFATTANGKGQSNGKWIKYIDARKVAEACKIIGGGRSRKGDAIHLGVGVKLHLKVGDAVTATEPLASIYADSENDRQAATEVLNDAFQFSDTPTEPIKLVKRVLA